MAVTTPASDPEIRVMSAASIATSVPVPIGKPDVGLGQGGCVVDAVADHADPSAFGLQAADLAGFMFGKDLGEDSGDPDLAGDRRGGAGVVAGDHHHLQAQFAQRCDRCDRVVFDGVGDGEHPGRLAVDGGQDRAFARGGKPLADLLQFGRVDATFDQQCCGADEHGVSGDGGPYALAGDRGEVLGGGNADAAVPGSGDDRGGDGVFTVGLGRSHQDQQLILAQRAYYLDVGEGGFAGGDRAGLIQHDGVELVRGLQSLGRADQDARAGHPCRCRP